MTLNEYQEKAMETCLPSSKNFIYALSGLSAEIGEIQDKIAKGIRQQILSIENNEICRIEQDLDKWWNFKQNLKKEIGDCLWFIALLCKVGGTTIENIAQMNLDKLASRKERKVIDGNGDNR